MVCMDISDFSSLRCAIGFDLTLGVILTLTKGLRVLCLGHSLAKPRLAEFEWSKFDFLV